MSKTTCEHRLITSGRSCPGCGMRPGKLHNNGLCMICQHPELAELLAQMTQAEKALLAERGQA
jgi:hypothetical protein